MRVFATTLALLSLATLALPDTLRSEIDAVSKSYDAAVMKKDIAGIAKILRPNMTANFQHVEDGKAMTFDQMIAQMKFGIGLMTKVTGASAKVITLKQSGNKATGTSERAVSGTLVGSDKKVHKMSFVGTTQDTYVLEGKKWKMSKMVWVSQKRMLDGKVLPAPPTKARSNMATH